MKTSDISDQVVLDTIARLSVNSTYLPVSRWDLEKAMPYIPSKLLRRKLSQMINREVISGCVCGCRGDFEIL